MKITIRRTLEKRRLSIRSAAKKCGLPYSTLIDICAEKVMPRLDTLEIIATGLGCKIEDLYEVTDISVADSQTQENVPPYKCKQKNEHQRKKVVRTDEEKKLRDDIKELLERIGEEEKLKRIYSIVKYLYQK